MFTSIQIDDEGTSLDMFVKCKKFNTKTDGKYTLFVLAQIDPVLKQVTGRYAILKLSEVHDPEKEISLLVAKEEKNKQKVIKQLESDMILGKQKL